MPNVFHFYVLNGISQISSVVLGAMTGPPATLTKAIMVKWVVLGYGVLWKGSKQTGSLHHFPKEEFARNGFWKFSLTLSFKPRHLVCSLPLAYFQSDLSPAFGSPLSANDCKLWYQIYQSILNQWWQIYHTHIYVTWARDQSPFYYYV